MIKQYYDDAGLFTITYQAGAYFLYYKNQYIGHWATLDEATEAAEEYNQWLKRMV